MSRENTKFEEWVRKFGIRKLVTELRDQGHSITESGVHHWLRGQHEPRGPKLRAIMKLAGGEITAVDVMDHFRIREGNMAVAR